MNDLKDAIRKVTDEKNKISCQDALAIAENLKISPTVVTKELNIQKIKIKQCQLGLFK